MHGYAAKPVTPTIENYLKTIYLLQQQTGDARLADIADGMAVSRPSANRAVALLTERSMAEHEEIGPIRLTPPHCRRRTVAEQIRNHQAFPDAHPAPERGTGKHGGLAI